MPQPCRRVRFAEAITPHLSLSAIRSEAAHLTAPFAGEAEASPAGKHCFVDASEPAAVRRVFEWHLHRTVPGTSACILVPDWPHARFNHYLKGGQLLKQYAAGTHGRLPLRLVHMPALPVVAPRLSAVTEGVPAPLTMHFAGTLAGYPARISADSQASHNYVTQGWATLAGVHVSPFADTVELGDGSAVAQIVGRCSLRMHVGSLHDRVEFLVLASMGVYHDAILRKCAVTHGSRSPPTPTA